MGSKAVKIRRNVDESMPGLHAQLAVTGVSHLCAAPPHDDDSLFYSLTFRAEVASVSANLIGRKKDSINQLKNWCEAESFGIHDTGHQLSS